RRRRCRGGARRGGRWADSCFSPAWVWGLAVSRPMRATLVTGFLLGSHPGWAGLMPASRDPDQRSGASGGGAERGHESAAETRSDPWGLWGPQRNRRFRWGKATLGDFGVKRPLRRK